MVALTFWFLAALLCWWVFAGTNPLTLTAGFFLAWGLALLLGRHSSHRAFCRFLWRLAALLPRAYGQGWSLILNGRTVETLSAEDLWDEPAPFVLERIYLITLTPDAVALGRDGEGRLLIHGLEVER